MINQNLLFCCSEFNVAKLFSNDKKIEFFFLNASFNKI